jgi:hypothetical protein
MKEAIERLKQAVTHIQALRLANEDDEKYRDWAVYDISETVTQLASMELGAPYKEAAYMANRLIQEAIALLKAPRWETPEQYEKRTGEKWPDDWAVYALYEDNDGNRDWFCGTHHCEQKKKIKIKNKNPLMIICATEAGPPALRLEAGGGE